MLLNYGLRETDRHAGPKAAAAAAEAAAEAAAARARDGGDAEPAAAPPPPWTPASIGRDGPDARWWRWRRLELWQHSDRLDTLRVGAPGPGGKGAGMVAAPLARPGLGRPLDGSLAAPPSHHAVRHAPSSCFSIPRCFSTT
jgi:hypothetical protein